MAKKILLLIGICIFINSDLISQKRHSDSTSFYKKVKSKVNDQIIKKVKFSGYIQAQYQWGQRFADLKVGNPKNEDTLSFSRIGLRRNRLKLQYDEGLTTSMFQFDLSDKGIGIKDAYFQVREPWLKSSSGIKIGIFNRPFGNEVGRSTAKLESPERAFIIQTLFPDERDIGAMITLQAPKKSAWNFFKLDGGLFAGNGIRQETDSRLDFISHLNLVKEYTDGKEFGGGISYYNGSVFQGTKYVYDMRKSIFTVDSSLSNMGKYANRNYVGFNAQITIPTHIGITQFRAEYISGTQPGVIGSTSSPNSSVPLKADTYNRKFMGGYIYYVQDLGKLPLSIVCKYEWYDPNTQISGNDIGSKYSFTSAVDLELFALGFGVLWAVNENLRLQLYYKIIRNETSRFVEGYESDRKDNEFTIRVQCKF